MKNFFLYIAVITLGCAITGLFGCRVSSVRTAVPVIQNGVLDLRDWDFRSDGVVSLSGDWSFYWQQYLPPDSDSGSKDPDRSHYIKVPGTWNGHVYNGTELSGSGFATYRLKILHTSRKEPLAFKLLDMGTAYTIFINGRQIVSSGNPGTTAANTTPRFSPTVVEFEGPSDEIDMLVHVANFHHRSGGLWEPIKLGQVDDIRALRERTLLFDFFLLGSILIIGFYHIGLFWSRQDDRSSLYFGIFCLLIAIRLLTTGERFIIHLVPGLSYEWLNKSIYLSFYLCVPVFAQYVKTLFPQEISNKAVFPAQVASVLASTLVLLAPAQVYTVTMPGYQLFTLLLLGYANGAVVLSVYRRRNGALVFLCGFLVFCLAVLNDILYTRQMIDTGHFTHIGFFIFIFSQAFIISKRFSAAYEVIEDQGRKLKESEHKYRIMAENVSDTIWILNLATLTFDYVSPSVEKNRGFTPDEVQAMGLEKTLSPESYTHVAEMLGRELEDDRQAGVEKSRSRTVEIEQSIKGGGYAWAEATVSFLRDEDGTPTALMGITRDISERKRSETRLLESERKFRNLFENGSDLLCIHDLAGNLLETNLPFKKEYGWTRQDLEGVNFKDFIPERYKNEFDLYMQRLLAHGADEGLVSAKDRSGELIILEYRNRMIYDASGAPQAVQGSARDITERYKTEKALRESEEKNKRLVEYAPAGICEFDIEKMKFISVNDVMCQYTGYSEREFLKLDPLAILTPESQVILSEVMEKMYTSTPRELATEYQIKTKDNNTFHVLANARFFYENGVPKRTMAVVHDLTDIRQAEIEKRKLEAQLQNAKKLEALGTLAGGVAHDLNNILSGVVGYPDLLLLDLDANSPFYEPLLTIKKSGEKAAEIVRDLLTLARRGVQSRKVVNLNLIVHEFIEAPEYQKIVSGNDSTRVVTDLHDNILNITGSATHLSKALMNLVANAVDAMPAGGVVTVKTQSYYFDKVYNGFESIPEGEYTALEITDTGIGMPASDLEHIFEPFFTKKVMGRSGTGLGMSVVWGTVKDHGGFIDIVTREGSGTRFALYFPATRQEEQFDETVYIDDYLGKGESILVIDDSTEQRELTTRMMQRIGYAVEAACSGEEAVEMVREKAYDLLILDMVMEPGISGLQTYRKISRHVPGQKAIIASGFSENSMVQETQQLGAGKYVKKPYTLEKIGLAVRSELDRPDRT